MRKFWLVAFFVLLPLSWNVRFAAAEETPPKASEDKDLDNLQQDLETLSSEKSQPGAPAEEAAAPQNEEAQPGAEQQPQPEPSKPPKEVVGVEVRGNQIVSTNTILAKIKTQKGMRLTQDTINEDVKRLYATGFFQDIKMEVEDEANGYVVVVTVFEKPIIRQINLKGFTRFKEDKLRKTLKVIEGQILDRKAIKEGVEAIRKLYGDKGYKFVDIDSQVDVNEKTKEAAVTIVITEGNKFKIKSIDFEGVNAFKVKKLTKLMKTKRKKLFSSGIFKEENFDKDIERIVFFYQQEGYLDVKVQPDFQYDEKDKMMVIKISVEEGPHYVTGEIKLQGNELFPESELWQKLEMLPGLTYSQYYLSKDIEKIRDYYHDQGHIDVRIVPDVKLNRDSGKVDVTYKIEEGDLYFVEKVIIRGNTKTRDIVIRRELRIRPGEKFDGEKIRKSKQRLENLGFFEDVTYDTQPSGEASNRKDLIFRVKEKRTGELSFGGGVSSVDRFVGFAEISQRNFDIFNFPRFTGDGQTLALRARVGSISKDFSLNFVEPYLFNKPIAWGNELYDIRRDAENTDFEEERLGAGTTLSRTFKDTITLGGGYTLERVKLDQLSDDAPAIVREFEGSNWLSRIKAFTNYDTRDNVYNPTKGFLATLQGDLIGSFLGGDQDYYILQTSLTKYWTFFKKHILEFRTRLGAAQSFGDSDNVPVFDRFYAGGLGTVRGYNYRRVGPLEAGDAVGGESLAIVNLEYTFPILKLDSFRGAIFVDAGQVSEDAYKFDFGETAISIGPGIKIKTPVGPVAFYYGFPIANRDTEDKNGRFEFSLSRGF
ncbi:MAG TPA: outer membrane protein assembly factor BamA [Verrucomicrobiae bacterium]|nr:outer membrane protein assembly factor BamA [Verrucomicrobiae bacterium]